MLIVYSISYTVIKMILIKSNDSIVHRIKTEMKI